MEGITGLEKDFVLLVGYTKPHEPKVVIEEDGKGSYAAMLTLFPHLEFADVKTEVTEEKRKKRKKKRKKNC
jgi:hypothetical protein